MKSPKSVDADAGVGSPSGSTSEIERVGTGINGGIDLSEDIVCCSDPARSMSLRMTFHVGIDAH